MIGSLNTRDNRFPAFSFESMQTNEHDPACRKRKSTSGPNNRGKRVRVQVSLSREDLSKDPVPSPFRDDILSEDSGHTTTPQHFIWPKSSITNEIREFGATMSIEQVDAMLLANTGSMLQCDVAS